MDTEAKPTPHGAAHHDEVSAEAKARGYETTDVHVGGLFTFVVALLVFLAIVFVGLVVLFKGYDFMNRYLDKRRAEREPGASSVVRLQPDYKGPLLQITPEEELQHLRDSDAAVLAGYGWVDRSKGTVRIPIDRAMDLIAQRGLPSTGTGQTVEAMQQQRADPQVYGQALRP